MGEMSYDRGMDGAPNPELSLYETDFYAWTRLQVRALADRRVADIDWAALAEEIDDLGNEKPREIRSRLEVLLLHLLKWAYQPEMRKGGWEATIIVQRNDITDVIEGSPSLRREPASAFVKAYTRARKRAAAETGLSIARFPESCPFALEDVLREDWLPDAAEV